MKETYRCEWVKCGKRCGGCPHGPYWYAYRREGGKTKKRYVGRNPPDTEEDDSGPDAGYCQGESESGQEMPHPWDAILSGRTANLALALTILGLTQRASLADAKAAYRRLVLLQHPDRNIGGSVRPFLRTQAAYEYVRTVLR